MGIFLKKLSQFGWGRGWNYEGLELGFVGVDENQVLMANQKNYYFIHQKNYYCIIFYVKCELTSSSYIKMPLYIFNRNKIYFLIMYFKSAENKHLHASSFLKLFRRTSQMSHLFKTKDDTIILHILLKILHFT